MNAAGSRGYTNNQVRIGKYRPLPETKCSRITHALPVYWTCMEGLYRKFQEPVQTHMLDLISGMLVHHQAA